MSTYYDDFVLVVVGQDGERTHALLKKLVFDFNVSCPMVVVSSRSFSDGSLVNWWKGVARDRGILLSLDFVESDNKVSLLNEGIKKGLKAERQGILVVSDDVELKRADTFFDFSSIARMGDSFFVGKIVYYPNTVNVFRGVRGSFTFPYFRASFIGGNSSVFEKVSLFDDRYRTFTFSGMDFYTRNRGSGYDFFQARNGDVSFVDEDDNDLTRDYQLFKDVWRDVIYEEY